MSIEFQAFDICERELSIPPIMTGQEMAECEVPDKLSMVSYISQVYESFRGEIPVGKLIYLMIFLLYTLL